MFKLLKVLLFILIIIPINSNGNNNNLDISKIIFEHILDSHDWHIVNNKIILHLPIILLNKNKKLEIFSSKKFYHGKLVKGKYNFYKMFKDKIYITNCTGQLNMNNKGNPINDQPILDLSITKNIISIILSIIILFIIFIKMVFSYKNCYTTWNLGILLEFLILFIRDEIVIPNIGNTKYKKYLPFLLTLFFFILINNLIGLIPGFPNVTGNINITFGLSAIVFFIMNLSSNKNYWKHLLWMPNVPIFIKIILAPIEFIGLFIRPMTLCIRLFANITAGHIVILSFICLIFIFKSLWIASFSIIFGFFIFLLEIMVSFLQAFIFTNISALLIGSVINYSK
ncbi:F0F1 ATP synthase subunit A [Blattabacterium cuenoti]|uniref:ATP synthase subunit a n=1 Tax=Blattabacterium sp. (Anaplecta omei) TaxID=2712789 RepID=A0A6G6BY56_9FLAO|nr:F0F1 ATP synthase subunit A [Blattabacterium cuenoti]QID56916.1 ATP synthase subunit A [Blattabacterium sp. (Anaplecta omei)]